MEDIDKETTLVLERFTARGVTWACSPRALEMVLLFVALWLIAGPFMHFSELWHMIMGTTSAAVILVVSFLLIRAQAKDTMAIQMKLNEVIGALQGANNELISIENMGEAALQEMSKRYETVATKIMHDDTVSTESIITHEIVAEEEERQHHQEEHKNDA